MACGLDPSRVESAEIQRSCGLELRGVEAERHEEKIRTLDTGVGRVVVEGHGREVGIGEFVIADIGTVDLELELVRLVEDGHGAARGGEVLDRVIVVEFLDQALGRDALLDLGDEHVLGPGAERGALVGVEVREVCVDVPAPVLGAVTPGDADFDVVVLEGHQRKRALPVFAEREPKGVELFVGRAAVEITGRGLGEVGGGKGGRDERGVLGVLGIHNLTAYQELDLIDYGGPIRDGCRVGVGDDVGCEVHVVEKVTLALEAHGGHAVVGDVPLDDLTLAGLTEICVTFVR